MKDQSESVILFMNRVTSSSKPFQQKQPSTYGNVLTNWGIFSFLFFDKFTFTNFSNILFHSTQFLDRSDYVESTKNKERVITTTFCSFKGSFPERETNAMDCSCDDSLVDMAWMFGSCNTCVFFSNAFRTLFFFLFEPLSGWKTKIRNLHGFFFGWGLF